MSQVKESESCLPCWALDHDDSGFGQRRRCLSYFGEGYAVQSAWERRRLEIAVVAPVEVRY